MLISRYSFALLVLDTIVTNSTYCALDFQQNGDKFFITER